MPLVSDHPRAEAVAEQVACALVAPVELLCVKEVQAMKRPRDSREPAFDDDVIVRIHQAEDLALELEASKGVVELAQEAPSILVISDDRAGVDPARDEVKEPLVR